MIEEIKKIKTRHKIIFSIIIGLAVISFWRGVWGLLDVYLFPNNYPLSLWLSVLIGILILAITGYVIKELT